MFGLLLFILGAFGCGRWGDKGPFEFTILFEDEMGLLKDDLVVYKDHPIGKVVESKLGASPDGVGGIFHVRVRIEGDYRGILDQNMIYEAAGERWLSKKKRIVVRDPSSPGPRAPIQPGDVIHGYVGEGEMHLQRLRKALESARKSVEDASVEVREFLDSVEGKVDESTEKSEVEKLLDKLNDLSQKAKEKEKEALEKVRMHLERLRDR